MPRSGLSPAFSPNNMRDVRVIYANEAKDALAHLSSPIVRDSPESRIPNYTIPIRIRIPRALILSVSCCLAWTDR